MGFELPDTSIPIARQTFNRIRNLRAEGGYVHVDVKEDHDKDYIGPELTTQVWTVKEAAQRAQALNRIAHKLPEKERAVAMDIIEVVIARCKEAQMQLMDPKIRPTMSPAPLNVSAMAESMAESEFSKYQAEKEAEAEKPVKTPKKRKRSPKKKKPAAKKDS